MERVAIFPGSFDPFTKGHFDIASRSTKLFDKVIIAIGDNAKKERYFEVEFMKERIESSFSGHPGVQVLIYDELTAKLAIRCGASYMVRGLRNTTDFEYENSISQINRLVNDKLETIFLITSPLFAPIRSSLIREVHSYGGDVSEFLPYSL